MVAFAIRLFVQDADYLTDVITREINIDLPNAVIKDEVDGENIGWEDTGIEGAPAVPINAGGGWPETDILYKNPYHK